MKKIAFFVGSLSKGGTERVVINLAGYFQSQGMDVLIITAWKNENEYEVPRGVLRFNAALTKEEWTRNKLKNVLLRNKKRNEKIKEFAPDIIVSFIKENNFKAILTGNQCKVPVVVSVRSDPRAEYPKLTERFLVNLLFPKAKGIVLQTGAMKDFFTQKSLRSKTVILPNSINQSFIKDTFPTVRRKEIVMVGRLDENKNQKLFIDAFAPLADAFYDWNCVIYGEGSERKRLEEAVLEKHLEGRITLPGSVRDIAEKIKDASIFVLTSGFEGMPNALLEAMALGLVPISTDCAGGGPREIIRDGENGFLIPVGDKEALTNQLRILMEEEKKREEMGMQARKIIKDLHPDVVNERWMQYLSSLCE